MTSKFLNKKLSVNGIKFDSIKEAKRHGELLLLEKAGEISGLHLQTRFPFKINDIKVCTYVCDFSYTDEKTNKAVVEDCKSEFTRRNPIYRIKYKLMRAVYGVTIKEV